VKKEVLVLLFLLAGCGGTHESAGPEATPPPPPSLKQLKNMTYPGIMEDPVTLAGGEWVGALFREGSSLRPRVHLVRDFVRTGDLDGVPGEEAVVLLESTTGGTGEYVHLAVVGNREGKPQCLATARLGDRVQVKTADLVTGGPGRIRLEVVRPGPGDAACCPGEVTWVVYAYGRTDLKRLPDRDATHRLSLADLADREWVLRYWSWNEPAPADPEVTLVYADGRFAGRNGCNSYFNGVEEEEVPGEIRVGIGGATRMACPDPAGAVEQRFTARLESVRRFGFMAGQLALTWEMDGETDVMLFEGREPAKSE